MSGMIGSIQKKLGSLLINYAIYVVLFVLVATISIKDPNFLSIGSLRNILLSSSTKLILALGSAMVLVSGGVDLSTGRVVGLAAVLSASMLQVVDYPRRFFPELTQLPL